MCQSIWARVMVGAAGTGAPTSADPGKVHDPGEDCPRPESSAELLALCTVAQTGVGGTQTDALLLGRCFSLVAG